MNTYKAKNVFLKIFLTQIKKNLMKFWTENVFMCITIHPICSGL